jgi:hypothetical protein
VNLFATKRDLLHQGEELFSDPWIILSHMETRLEEPYTFDYRCDRARIQKSLRSAKRREILS